MLIRTQLELLLLQSSEVQFVKHVRLQIPGQATVSSEHVGTLGNRTVGPE